MKEIITNKISMKGLIKLNKLNRAHLMSLLREMKEFYLSEEYYMTASKIHCVTVSGEYSMTYCLELAAKLFQPDFEQLVDRLYNDQYPETNSESDED